MGQDSIRAAMFYQHATSEAGRAIADAVSARIELAQAADERDDDGGPDVAASAG